MMHIDLLGILCGLAVLGIIGAVIYVAKHPPQAATANTKDLATTLAAGASETWEALKRDLPEIVSAEVAQLKADNAGLLKRATDAETALAAEVKASGVRLQAVQAQVGQFIAGIASQPAATLVAPAVAAAQAEDVSAVKAATVALSPAS